MSKSSKTDHRVPRLRIIAGPNGSGKSSYFYQLKNEVDTGIWINTDELNAELLRKGYIDFDKLGFSPVKKLWDSFIRLKRSISFINDFDLQAAISTLQFGNYILSVGEKTDNNALAAFIADFLRYSLIKDLRKFTTETVFSHPSKIQLAKEANKNGFRTYLYFICTESPELNIERVKSRTIKGGYSVPAQKIIEHYNKSLEVLKAAIPFFDRVFIFDNSKFEHTLILSIAKGKLEAVYTDDIPSWVKHVISEI